MSIQQPGPKYEVGDYRDDSLQQEAPVSHLTLVPQPVDKIAEPGQPDLSATNEKGHEAVLPVELASRVLTNPRSQNAISTLSSLSLGTVAGHECYSVPRFVKYR